ncbi:MAG: hypothetical protein JXQ85_07970 [Cognatishimia sp.]|uniref:hypothetical protein n=1 Tax=Cognatishimia sp. TaxID=2211648 RepID=UPI003B8CFCB8
MSILTLILIFKIAYTGLMIGLPFVFLPSEKLEKLTGVNAIGINYIRLYGWSVIAILVGYSFGIIPSMSATFPVGVVVMGIASNLGGAILLHLTGARKKRPGPFYIIGGIAVALIASAVFPDLAVSPIFK